MGLITDQTLQKRKKISELEDLAMRAIRKLTVVQRTNAHVTEALESKRREGGSRGQYRGGPEKNV